MNEQRKYAILFAATILAARKLNDSGSTPWAIRCAIIDAIEKANHILEKMTNDGPLSKRIGVASSSVNNSSIF